MTRFLRGLGVVLLVIGVIACAWGIVAAMHDEEFYRAAAALERHSADIPFQIEYYQALGRHAAYLFVAMISAIIAAILSTMLFALAAILTRLDRLENRGVR